MIKSLNALYILILILSPSVAFLRPHHRNHFSREYSQKYLHAAFFYRVSV